MSQSEDTIPSTKERDILAPIREHRGAIEELAEQEDRIGAIARYCLALERGEPPSDYDADLAGLPRIEGGDQQ